MQDLELKIDDIKTDIMKLECTKQDFDGQIHTELAINKAAISVASQIACPRAVLLSTVYNQFIHTFSKSTANSFTSWWFLSQLSRKLYPHNAFACRCRKVGTVIYHQGGDVLYKIIHQICVSHESQSIASSTHTEQQSIASSTHIESQSIASAAHIEQQSIASSTHIEQQSIASSTHIEQQSIASSTHIESQIIASVAHIEQQSIASSTHIEQQSIASSTHTEQQSIASSTHTEQQSIATSTHIESQSIGSAAHIEQQSIEVHVIFDDPNRYDLSPKIVERERRDKQTTSDLKHIHSKFEDSLPPSSKWTSVLRCRECKHNLTTQLAVHMVQLVQPMLLPGKRFVTAGSFRDRLRDHAVCVEHGNPSTFTDERLTCNIEEGDMRVWMHCTLQKILG